MNRIYRIGISRSSQRALFLLLVTLVVEAVRAGEMVSVAGRWSLEDGLQKPRYFFRDGDRESDLFSYHQRDSNADGIDEIRLRHEAGALVIESQ